ncbi:MAG: hypothetical protein GF401_17635 [Chitinivibrionales bacterium]|nr:hypothetical protein [Chitinivibrionales bacterium]
MFRVTGESDIRESEGVALIALGNAAYAAREKEYERSKKVVEELVKRYFIDQFGRAPDFDDDNWKKQLRVPEETRYCRHLDKAEVAVEAGSNAPRERTPGPSIRMPDSNVLPCEEQGLGCKNKQSFCPLLTE